MSAGAERSGERRRPNRSLMPLAGLPAESVSVTVTLSRPMASAEPLSISTVTAMAGR